MNIKSFEQAFRYGGAGCVRECSCGKVFYNSDGGWDWEEGEFDKLSLNPNNVDLDYAVESIFFLGKEYVMDCKCWHDKANKIMEFVDDHSYAIADYLKLEKKRKTAEAELMPTV